MPNVYATQLPQLLRRYHLSGGRLLGVRVRYGRSRAPVVVVRLRARRQQPDGTPGERVSLRLTLTDCPEFRFQKRPVGDQYRLRRVDLAYLSGRFYLSLDSMLGTDEKPEIMDFRASDLFVAGGELACDEVPPRDR